MMNEPYTEEDIADAESDALTEAETLKQAWAWLVNDRRGQVIVSRLLASTGWHGASYIPGDALGTAYREGQRSLGGAIFESIMATNPAVWPLVHAMMLGRKVG